MKNYRLKSVDVVLCILIFVFLFMYSFVIYEPKEKVIVYNDKNNNTKNEIEKENIKEEQPEVIKPEIVYDGLTKEELAIKLDKSLNSDLSGYGSFIANYSLEKGIDPYLATAIMLHETGCSWGCSSLVKNCHNVGGMKGTGCGQYGYFSNLEEGITKFIDNIYNNYYAYGLTNANMMGHKYAEDPNWSKKVNLHIEKIKNR